LPADILVYGSKEPVVDRIKFSAMLVLDTCRVQEVTNKPGTFLSDVRAASLHFGCRSSCL
jgi:hypothetical protein